MGSNTQQPKGFIVANDADAKRAFMLTHQMNRLNTSSKCNYYIFDLT